MSITRQTEILDSVFSTTGDSLTSATQADEYIARGRIFTIESVFTIASGDTTYDIIFDTSAMTRPVLVSRPTHWTTTAGPVIITLGRCTAYTGGTALTPTNRQWQYEEAYPAQTVFKYGAAATDFTASPTSILVGASSTPLFSGGGSTVGELSIWLEPGPIYVFRANNQSGEEIRLATLIDWLEGETVI